MTCEDAPCCGHGAGDCDGSDETRVMPTHNVLDEEGVFAPVACRGATTPGYVFVLSDGRLHCNYCGWVTTRSTGNSAQARADEIREEIEVLAREICDTYYLTVDPERMMSNAYDKITEATRRHWQAQARMMRGRGWRRDA